MNTVRIWRPAAVALATLVCVAGAVSCGGDAGGGSATKSRIGRHAGSAANYTANRAPLTPSAYLELPIGAIHPEGWLQEQLERMRDGLTGHMDSVYSAVDGPSNAWLGGDGDAWERGPYWIDGLLPLAYILDDDGLKTKAQEWIEWSLASQDSSGFFGPPQDTKGGKGLQGKNARDWWPRMVMLKVMKQYWQATGDGRVIDFLTRYFRYQLETLPDTPLDNWTFWGAQRGGDNLDIVYWLYNITGDKFLLDLGRLIHSQCYDWTGTFLAGETIRSHWGHHCVNLAQGFKEPVVYWQQSPEDKYLEACRQAAETIRHSVGLPNGLWGGDEMIHGDDPSDGSELCTAVEMMYSLEVMSRITGDVQWMDYLERVAYNALPAQVNADFTAKQYYQQTNQITCALGHWDFSTPHEGTDNVFGTLNGYPCCLSNMHQGWPKFVQNLWYATADGGAAALIYAPSRVRMRVSDGVEVEIKEETRYPFDGDVTFTLTFPQGEPAGAAFPLSVRIPGWCSSASLTLNGEAADIPAEAGSVVTLDRTWRSGDRLSLSLPQEVRISRWHDGAACFERGPLVYALKMDEVWTWREYDSKHMRKTYGGGYWEVTSDSPWNWAFDVSLASASGLGDKCRVTVREEWPEWPWTSETAPVSIFVDAMQLPGWHEYNGNCGPIRYTMQGSVPHGPLEQVELIPYGCAKLRITEFPLRRVN